ncbi:MAG: prolipoprotein diacylglyceryl transferase family protein [Bacteroidota bacterium]
MTGKILYGALFTLLLPLLLVLWAVGAEANIALPVFKNIIVGSGLVVAGVALLAGGIFDLRRYGKGLPMNAFPPPEYVTRGFYKAIPHPIYTGFCVAVFGVSLAVGSAAGMWLISPVVVLGCIALVLGYERPDMQKRFGELYQRIYILPPPAAAQPVFKTKFLCAVLVFLPWLFLYELVAALPLAQYSFSLQLNFEKAIPVVEWTESVYAFAYVFVVATPFFLKKNSTLRRFCIDGFLAIFFGISCFIIFPVAVPEKQFSPTGFWGEFLLLERSFDTSLNAFPSFHALWAFIAAGALSRDFLKGKFLFWSIAILISVSCITTGMHVIADIAAAFLLFLIIEKKESLLKTIFTTTEKIANSWREWRIGPLRIINHSFYAGFAAFAGVLLACVVSGGNENGWIFFIALCSMFGAGIWAQVVEGSSSLLRPFGYYGAIIGGIFGIALATLFGANFWLIFSVFAIAAPFIQAFGRLRCLVQGCCHGAECKSSRSIVYSHPQSRVVRLSDLGFKSVHATPLYSIASNLVTGIFLLGLWRVNCSPAMIAGLYFIFNGLSRFVEEAYRGEPQTKVLAGLRLYQWIAIASVVFGAIVTVLPAATFFPNAAFKTSSLLFSVVFGLCAGFAQGMDFPESNRRFARLV